MKAMIFAAGLGTRLKPLTNEIPKALVKFKEKPLLQIVIEKLKLQNINEFVINVHHYSEKVIRFLNENKNFGCEIQISDETDLLLDTGGGLFNASKFLGNQSFLIHNVDIFADIDINKLYEKHVQSEAIATLAVQNRKSDKRLYFSEFDGSLCKWKNEISGEEKIAKKIETNQIPFAYSGICMINPKIFNFMENGVYSIIDTFLKAAKTEKLNYLDHSGSPWKDMGKPECFTDIF